MRLFETTGTGSFMLTEYHENIDRYFEPRTEIETFEGSTEMLEKIEYYLEHPEEREAIARKGQERCLKQYSMEVRTAEFDKIVKKYLSNEINKQKAKPTSWVHSSKTLKEDSPSKNKIESKEVSNLTDAAEKQIGQKNFVGASRAFENALKIEPENHWVNINLGNTMLKMGKTERCLHRIQECDMC